MSCILLRTAFACQEQVSLVMPTGYTRCTLASKSHKLLRYYIGRDPFSPMKFGVFDHLDRGDLPLKDYYEARLKLIEAYDQAGFYAYHVAEHHSTPLGMAPSPSVFLAAVAQRTRRLRFGPLVYALPLYHPIRLIEEICMLKIGRAHV